MSIDDLRHQLAELVGVEDNEIEVTSGGGTLSLTSTFQGNGLHDGDFI